jgi:hypothetical protein
MVRRPKQPRQHLLDCAANAGVQCEAGGGRADECRAGMRIASDEQFVQHMLGIPLVVEDCCEIVAHDVPPGKS